MSARGIAAAALFACALPALAQQESDAGAPPALHEIELRIYVGETVSLGTVSKALIVAPVLCDDGSIVERTSGESGLALRGLKPGETSCSGLTAAYTTQRYHVRVVEPPPAPSK